MSAVGRTLGTVLRELWGLFVEDGTLTIGIVACVLVAVFVLARVPLASQWRGGLLFLLLAAVLLENVARTARRK